MSWRRVWKEISIWGMLVLLLAGFGAVVWATHHPDHPLLARAAGWPAVGPLVERFQAYYGVGHGVDVEPGPGEVAETADGDGAGEAGGTEWIYVPEEGAGDSRIVPTRRLREGEVAGEGGERIWIAAGQEVRREPADSARLVGRQEAFQQVDVLQRSGDWARVASDAGIGWVRAPAAAEAAPPLGSGLKPNLPVPGARPDSRELVAARELMGVEGPAGALGPYDLYTDVEPVSRLFLLDRVAHQAEAIYRRRYGRPLTGEPAEAILVFGEETVYRLYQTREARLQGLPTGGHSGRGLVAFWIGGRPPHEQAATLLHELGHLLNRRAVGPALPPWLDEGMAEDLSLSRVGEAGQVDPDRLGGLTVRGQGRVEFQGAAAGLRHLNAAFARTDAPRLEELVSLDWDQLVRSERLTLHYAHAGFFIRYLVETPELAEGFRRFLDRVAAGGPATGEALRQELDRSWQQLDDGLAEWVRGQILETTLEARGGQAGAPPGDP